MAFYRKSDGWGGYNRWRQNVARASRRNAEARKCPACQRKAALGKNLMIGSYGSLASLRICRWCGHEEAVPRAE